MDIETKDGIVLRGIPDGTPDEAIKARIAQIRAGGSQPATSQPPPVQPSEQPSSGPAMTPATRRTIEGLKQNGWGTGLPHLAYEAGAGVTDAASKVPFMRGVPAATLGYLTNVGISAIPSLLSGKVAQETALPVIDKASRIFMQSAVGPTKADVLSGKAGRAVNTLLEEGINPTEGGIAVTKAKVADLANEARQILDPSKQMVSTAGAAQNAAGVADKARLATMGIENAKPAENVVAALQAHPRVDQLGLMTVQDANAMKQANYASLGDAAYGLGLKPAAERDAVKAATAAIRKAIETAEPGVAPINKRMADLMNAVKVSEAKALMQANKNPLPIGSSFALATKNPLAALSLWANSSAYAKALAARALYQGSKAMPAVGAMGGAALGAQMGQAPDEEEMKARAYAAALQRLGVQ